MINYKIQNTNTTNSDGNILVVKDITGVYSETNTGGYGTPNDTRTSLALVLVSTYVSSKGELPVSIVSNDPTTVDTFTVNLTKDGWYKFKLLSFKIYTLANLQSYSLGDVYYNITTNTLVRIVKSTVPNLLAIEEIDISKVDNSYVVAVDDAFIVYTNSKTKTIINSQISDLLTNNVDYTDKRLVRLKDNYNAVRAILQGAVYEFCRGNKYVAQKSIEFLNQNNYVSV